MARCYRKEFTTKVKLAIRSRARRKNDEGEYIQHDDGTYVLWCDGCGKQIPQGDEGDVDHKTPEWSLSERLKEERDALTEDDGQLLGDCCHKRKTKKEAGDRARNNRARRGQEEHKKRMAEKDLGIKKERKWRGRKLTSGNEFENNAKSNFPKNDMLKRRRRDGYISSKSAPKPVSFFRAC